VRGRQDVPGALYVCLHWLRVPNSPRVRPSFASESVRTRLRACERLRRDPPGRESPAITDANDVGTVPSRRVQVERAGKEEILSRPAGLERDRGERKARQRRPVSRVLCPEQWARGDGHFSRTPVTRHLQRPDPSARRATSWRSYSTLLRVGFAEPARSPAPLVSSYLTVSPLPPLGGGLLSVALVRGVSPPWALPSTLPCGARTFLPPRCRGRRPSGLLWRTSSIPPGGTGRAPPDAPDGARRDQERDARPAGGERSAPPGTAVSGVRGGRRRSAPGGRERASLRTPRGQGSGAASG